MKISKTVLIYSLVIKCVKVGVKCIYGEGIAPASGSINNGVQLGPKNRILCENIKGHLAQVAKGPVFLND